LTWENEWRCGSDDKCLEGWRNLRFCRCDFLGKDARYESCFVGCEGSVDRASTSVGACQCDNWDEDVLECSTGIISEENDVSTV
jgi:hypothetical protein